MKINRKVKVLISGIVIAVSLMSGMTFATIDPVTKFETWYKDRFKESIEKIGRNLEGLVHQVEEEYTSYGETIIEKSKKRMEETYLKTYSDGIDNIINRKQVYIVDLEEAQKLLKANVQDDYNKYVIELNEEINQIIDREIMDFIGNWN